MIPNLKFSPKTGSASPALSASFFVCLFIPCVESESQFIALNVVMENSENSEVLIQARSRTRDLVAFWILGLCNNYGYVVMLTASLDIVNENTVRSEYSS